MNKNEIRVCPFCGGRAEQRTGMGGIDFFYCTYARCGAIVSFAGNAKTASGHYQAADPRGNWERRADIAAKNRMDGNK